MRDRLRAIDICSRIPARLLLRNRDESRIQDGLPSAAILYGWQIRAIRPFIRAIRDFSL
jgi:hypothetical protein